MIEEYKRVVLTADLPDTPFKAGDVGVVVHIHGDHAGYEIEMFALDGRTIDVVTVDAHQVRPPTSNDMPSARRLDG
jgi:hypothetical protein